MQTKPSDTPKVIALLVATAVVIVIVIWQILAANRPPAATATTTPPVGGATGGLAMGASAASDTALPGPGEIRDTELVDLDRIDEQQAEQLRVNPVQSGPVRASMFQVIESPGPGGSKSGTSGSSGGTQQGQSGKTLPGPNPGPQPGPGSGQTPPTPGPSPEPAFVTRTEYREIIVDGVLTGPNGFLMMTEGDETTYRRVGDKFAGYTITRLSENGVVVRKKGEEPALWPVGEPVKVPVKVLVPVNGPSVASVGAPPAAPSGGARTAALAQDSFVKAQSFTATATNGKTINFPADFKGKVVLLDFWATWCPPCREEIPHLVAAYKQYRSKGLAVVGVSLDEANSERALAAFTRQSGMTWSQIYDASGESPIARMYNIRSIPSAFLVDGSTGKILAMGNSLRGAGLANTLQQALAKR